MCGFVGTMKPSICMLPICLDPIVLIINLYFAYLVILVWFEIAFSILHIDHDAAATECAAE
jgi:hypothetical protein